MDVFALSLHHLVSYLVQSSINKEHSTSNVPVQLVQPPPPPQAQAPPPPPPPPLQGIGPPPPMGGLGLPKLPTKTARVPLRYAIKTINMTLFRKMYFDSIAKDPNSIKNSIFIKNDIAKQSNSIIETLNTKELEKLFAATIKTPTADITPSNTTKRKELISIIEDSNRSRSISLKIGSLRNQGLCIDKIASSIINVDDAVLNDELLEAISQIVPTNEELDSLKKTDADTKDLQEPEQLFYKVIIVFVLPLNILSSSIYEICQRG
jgi:hypothetical protein